METMSVNFREILEREYRAYANRWSQQDAWYWDRNENESALILSAFENRLRSGLVYNTLCKQIQP